MTLRAPHLVYAAVAVAAVVLLVRGCGSEEKRVMRRLDDLAEIVDRGEGESALDTAARARRLGEMFTDPFTVRLEPFGQEISDRQGLMRTFAAYRGGYRRIEVGWRDVEIAVAPGERQASATAVAVASGLDAGGLPARDAFRLTFRWQREDGEWRLREVVLVEVLEGLESFL